MGRGHLVSKSDLSPIPGDPSLVDAWGMGQRPVGVVQGVEGNSGTLVNRPIAQRTQLGRALLFVDGEKNGIDITGVTAPAGPMTFAFRVRPDNDSVANQSLIATDGGFQLSWRANNSALMGMFDGTDWQVVGNGPPAGHMYDIVYVFDGVDAYRVYIDGLAFGVESDYNPSPISGATRLMSNTSGFTNHVPGQLVSAEIYSEAKSEQWIKEYSRRGRRSLWDTRVVGNSSVSTSDFVGDSPFRTKSGSFQILTDTINEETISVLECVTDGVVSLPASVFKQSKKDAAFYEWDLYLNKNADSDFSFVFCSDSVGGADVGNNYSFFWGTNDNIQIRRNDYVIHDMGTLASGGYKKIAVRRPPVRGHIQVAIDDVEVGATIDQTHTSSSYVNIQMGAGDKAILGAQSGRYAMRKGLRMISDGLSEVACVGDSLTYGIGGFINSYPRQLNVEHSWRSFINLGVPGYKTTDVINYSLQTGIERSDEDVILLISVNDIQDNETLSNIAANFETIWAAFTAAGKRVITVHPTPWDGDGEQAKIDKTLDVISYIDANAPGPIVDTSSLGDGNYNLLPAYDVDGLHLNDAGYAVLSDLIRVVAYPGVGDELFTNGDFATGDTSGWTVSASAPATVSVTDKTCRINSPGGQFAQIQQSPMNTGDEYQLVIDVASGFGSLDVLDGSTLLQTLSNESGIYKYQFVATAPNVLLKRRGVCDYFIRSASLRLLDI